jgi:hypothetical protein
LQDTWCSGQIEKKHRKKISLEKNKPKNKERIEGSGMLGRCRGWNGIEDGREDDRNYFKTKKEKNQKGEKRYTRRVIKGDIDMKESKERK